MHSLDNQKKTEKRNGERERDRETEIVTISFSTSIQDNHIWYNMHHILVT